MPNLDSSKAHVLYLERVLRGKVRVELEVELEVR